MLLPCSVAENFLKRKFEVFRCFLEVPCLLWNRGAQNRRMDGGALICDCAATISSTIRASLCTRPKHHPRHAQEVHEDWIRDGQARFDRKWAEKNVAAAGQVFDLSQEKSIRRASSEFNISATSFQMILRRDLRFFPDKIHVVQKLEPQDYDSRMEMCETLFNHFQRNPSILEQMWFSDEALFHLSGRCNRHNTCIWGLANSAQVHEYERDTPELIIWCAISSAGLISPFFFRDRKGHSVMSTVINNFVCFRNSVFLKCQQYSICRSHFPAT